MKVPKLRFFEFKDSYVLCKLGEILFERKEQCKISEDTPLLAFAAGQGVIDRSERKTNNRDFLTKDASSKKYLLTKIDDIVYNPSNLKYGAIDRNKHGRGVISPIYVTFETNQIPSYIELIVKSEKFKQRALQYEEGTVTKRQSVKPENLLNLEVSITTSLNEQKKVGMFFDKTDKKIQLQQEKIDLLKEQKKAYIQKIFSQELRFKDNNGDEFPNWKTQTLNTLGEFGKSYSYSRAFEGKGTVQHIHYGDIHSNLSTVCEQIQFPFITEQREFEFVNTGDILFADASEDYNDLGKAILIKSLQSDKTIAGLHTHKFTPNELIYPLYLIYLTQTRSYRTFIKKFGTGVSVLGISKTNLSKFEVPLPSLNEQIKIGEFLFSFDKKITTLEKQKIYLIQQKQAFIQQMFI